MHATDGGAIEASREGLSAATPHVKRSLYLTRQASRSDASTSVVTALFLCPYSVAVATQQHGAVGLWRVARAGPRPALASLRDAKTRMGTFDRDEGCRSAQPYLQAGMAPPSMCEELPQGFSAVCILLANNEKQSANPALRASTGYTMNSLLKDCIVGLKAGIQW